MLAALASSSSFFPDPPVSPDLHRGLSPRHILVFKMFLPPQPHVVSVVTHQRDPGPRQAAVAVSQQII